jgi:hypothetical protein
VRRRSHWAVTGLAFACACGITFALAPVSRAATYQVIECARAQGAAPAPDAIAFNASFGFTATNSCDPSSGSDGLQVFGASGASEGGERAGWRFFAPPATQFVAASVFVRGLADDGVVPQLVVANTAVPGVSDRFGDESNIDQFGAIRTWDGEPMAMNLLEARLICTEFPPAKCGSSQGAFIEATGVALTLEEGSPPTLTSLAGPLVSDPDSSVRGVVDLAIGGTDAGAGLYTGSLSAGGHAAAEGAFFCDVTPAGIARRLVPCPASAELRLPVDTRADGFYTGLNRVSACVVDFAGQGNCAERDVRVDNVCPETSGVSDLDRIRFAGGGADKRDGARRRVVVRFGPGVRLLGRAVDRDGDPVRGATVCLGSHIAGNPYAPETVDEKKTGKRGRFRFRLRAGPNRALRIAAFPGGDPIEAERTLLVRARPSLRIEGKRGPGAMLRFLVRLNKPVVPGQKVEIRARSDAGWVGLPGCDRRTDDGGRFSCRFEIPPTAGGATLRFRAVVFPTGGYPYLQGHSRTRKVQVRR